MKRILALGGLSLCLLAVPDTVAAATIDFDDVSAPGLFASTSALTNQYIALGVTFSGGGAILNESSGFGVGALSGSNFLAFNTSTYATGPLTMDFTAPIASFSIFGSGGAHNATFRWQAFDSALTLIDSGSIASASGTYATISSAIGGISRVRISVDDADYVYDNLSFTSTAPEPGTLALFGLAVVGAAVRRRRPTLSV